MARIDLDKVELLAEFNGFLVSLGGSGAFKGTYLRRLGGWGKVGEGGGGMVVVWW